LRKPDDRENKKASQKRRHSRGEQKIQLAARKIELLKEIPPGKIAAFPGSQTVNGGNHREKIANYCQKRGQF
jgi:hypothetical protein